MLKLVEMWVIHAEPDTDIAIEEADWYYRDIFTHLIP